MKQTFMAGALLLVAFGYLSWRNNGNTAALRAEKERRLEMLENVFSGGKSAAGTGSATAAPANSSGPAASTSGDGQPVPRSAYQPCLDSFVSVMHSYGITADNPPAKITSMPPLTYPITTYESFQGSGFISWLDGVVTKYDPSGKGANIDLRLQFGVCTAKFVADMKQPASLVGRITIFVVPAYRKTAMRAASQVGNPGDPGDDGYSWEACTPDQ